MSFVEDKSTVRVKQLGQKGTFTKTEMLIRTNKRKYCGGFRSFGLNKGAKSDCTNVNWGLLLFVLLVSNKEE